MDEMGRILGLDIGEVRIGVALSDPMRIIASPHSLIETRSPQKDAEAIDAVAREVEAVRIVAGIPLNLEGKPGPQATKVLEFLEKLRAVVDIEVVTQDERFSTAASERTLREARVKRKKRKKIIDKVAASHILQTYLDRESNRKKVEG